MNFAMRIAVAVIFLAHGWPKLKNLKTTAENFNAMGFRPGRFWGTLIALLETVGAGFLFIGAGTQILAILFAVEMAVVIVWKIRKGEKLLGGCELELALLAASLVLMTSGGGVLGLDNHFRIW